MKTINLMTSFLIFYAYLANSKKHTSYSSYIFSNFVAIRFLNLSTIKTTCSYFRNPNDLYMNIVFWEASPMFEQSRLHLHRKIMTNPEIHRTVSDFHIHIHELYFYHLLTKINMSRSHLADMSYDKTKNVIAYVRENCEFLERIHKSEIINITPEICISDLNLQNKNNKIHFNTKVNDGALLIDGITCILLTDNNTDEKGENINFDDFNLQEFRFKSEPTHLKDTLNIFRNIIRYKHMRALQIPAIDNNGVFSYNPDSSSISWQILMITCLQLVLTTQLHEEYELRKLYNFLHSNQHSLCLEKEIKIQLELLDTLQKEQVSVYKKKKQGNDVLTELQKVAHEKVLTMRQNRLSYLNCIESDLYDELNIESSKLIKIQELINVYIAKKTFSDNKDDCIPYYRLDAYNLYCELVDYKKICASYKNHEKDINGIATTEYDTSLLRDQKYCRFRKILDYTNILFEFKNRFEIEYVSLKSDTEIYLSTLKKLMFKLLINEFEELIRFFFDIAVKPHPPNIDFHSTWYYYMRSCDLND